MIQYADEQDFDILKKYDKHIDAVELQKSIADKKVLIMFNDAFSGWLRYNLFWDSIPFMNMLYLLEDFRGKGYGKQLVDFWEREMQSRQYKIVMTSTQSDEQAQFFYRRIGYVDCGALLLPNEPLEIILSKSLA
ncbi:MAG: GNAT family N-acetyltransferase [Lachnoclostridium sp.]|nr:GNAT family N-acetyltransferase [Lachnospira sp.]MCM1249306.1 GNAT family N-acetyltransferase [Lachnoclostridium sp.]